MKKILVLSASIGAGHVSAAEALCQVYQEEFGGKARHVDFLRYTSPKLSRVLEQSYYLMTKRVPSIYRFIYEMTDRPYSLSKKLEVYIGVNKCKELIAEFQPDFIIATHFLPAAVVSYMYPYISTLNGVVLTDYVPHRIWVYPHNQLFFVAHKQMKHALKGFGVEQSRIKVTGIPARPSFKQNINRKEIKKKLGMKFEQPLVLLMSGGNAIGPLAQVLESLRPLRDKIQVVAITGKNHHVYKKLLLLMDRLQLPWRVLGFVDNMHEWMAAADLLISKPGGLTVTETLISELPMLIIRPTPGQEDGNTDFLINSGVGIYIEKLEKLSRIIEELFANPSQLCLMRENAKLLAKRDAAKKILQEVETFLAGR